MNLKKRHSVKLILLTTLLLGFTSFLNSQNLSMTLTGPSPNKMKVCEETTFSISLAYASWMSSGFTLTIHPDLYDKLVPQNLIADENGTVTGIYCMESVSTSGNNAMDLTPDNYGSGFTYSFDGINNWTIDPLPSNTIVSFDLKIRMHCSLFFAANLLQTWTCTYPGGNVPVNINTSGSNFYQTDVLPVNFTSLSPVPQIPAAYGTETILEFVYGNDGTFGSMVEFQMTNSSACAISPFSVIDAQYEFKNTLAQTGPSNSSTTFFGTYNQYTNIAIPDPLLLKYLHVFVKIKINKCISPCLAQDFYFNYRCYNFIPSCCNNCRTKQNKSSVNLVPCTSCASLQISEPVISNPSKNKDASCVGDPVQWEIVIQNPASSTGVICSTEVHLTNPQTHSGNFNLASLSLIDATTCSLSISAGSACSVVKMNKASYTTFDECATLMPANTTLCNVGLPGTLAPIESLDFFILEMHPGDVITLTFSTHKCVEENSVLLNEVKYFNHWTINAKNYDVCTGNQINVSHSGGYGAASNNISSHAHKSGGDVNLALTYNPTFTDFLNDATTGLSAPYPCTMDLDNLFVSDDDYQLIGSKTGPYDGIFRVKFHPQDGIKLEDINLNLSLLDDISLVTNNGTGVTLTPDYAYRALSGCTEDDYFFYYNLNQIPVNAIDDLLKRGVVNFNLIGCCGGPNKNPEYKFEFALLLNDNSNTCENFTIPTSSGPPVCGTSGTGICPWLPLSSVSHKTHLHCPGCVSPGIIVDNYSLERTQSSLGFEDPLNLETKASNAPQITKNSLYYDNNKIAANISIHNDELEDRLVSYFLMVMQEQDTPIL